MNKSSGTVARSVTAARAEVSDTRQGTKLRSWLGPGLWHPGFHVQDMNVLFMVHTTKGGICEQFGQWRTSGRFTFKFTNPRFQISSQL